MVLELVNLLVTQLVTQSGRTRFVCLAEGLFLLTLNSLLYLEVRTKVRPQIHDFFKMKCNYGISKVLTFIHSLKCSHRAILFLYFKWTWVGRSLKYDWPKSKVFSCWQPPPVVSATRGRTNISPDSIHFLPIMVVNWRLLFRGLAATLRLHVHENSFFCENKKTSIYELLSRYRTTVSFFSPI